MVTKCTTSLTFNYSTFCPHSVFMCFVWISEQTDIISLYNINWLIFITEAESIYCEVRTGSLSQTDAGLSLKGSYRFWQDNYSSTNNALLIYLILLAVKLQIMISCFITFNPGNQNVLSVCNISNHTHDIDTDIQIHIYLHSNKSRYVCKFPYTKCHKPI